MDRDSATLPGQAAPTPGQDGATPQTAFLLQSARRFQQIEGKHLTLVISINLFVASLVGGVVNAWLFLVKVTSASGALTCEHRSALPAGVR
jgi:hypothetical protein